MYFDQYSDSPQDEYNKIGEEKTLRSKGGYHNYDDIEEDEDLSMVSDASSGPPHLHEDKNCFVRNQYVSYISDHTKGNQKEKKEVEGDEDKSHLDDTASSPVVDFPKEKIFSKHFSFLKTSGKGKGATDKPGDGLQGKKW